MIFEKTSVLSAIDPGFQRLLERRDRGLVAPPTSSTAEDEVAVLARVTDVDEWENLSEVYVGMTIGTLEEGILVTGRIPVSRIEAVRRAPCVLSLKPAQRMRPMLAATIEETDARADLLPQSASGNQGDGVLVAIIDYDCDFVHHSFRNTDGTTRLLGIWDQRFGFGLPNSPVPYGTFYSRSQINQALQQADPYKALGYQPDFQSHGTHVMDIAAGGGLGTGVPGVAPNADLLFIHPDSSDVPWSGPEVVGKDLGDSVQFLEAVAFAFEQSAGQPCVVNMSLGTNGGPHDGTNLVEQGIDALASSAPNRAVVIAASNSFDDGIHAAGKVAEGGSADLMWNVDELDFTGNEVEIWYSADDVFSLELILPDGTSLGQVALGENGRIRDDSGNTLLFVANRAADPGNGDNNIGIFLESSVPQGTWALRLHGKSVEDGGFHAWIERDDRGQSSFVHANPDNSHTLGSISTGHKSIVVGSYDAHKSSLPLSWFSSSGPTRDGREKPELSGPGHNVIAAGSRTEIGTTRMSGTSMASPAVAGVVALILSEAHARDRDLSIDEVRQVLIDTVRSSPPSSDWDPRYGHGRINASAAVQAILDG